MNRFRTDKCALLVIPPAGILNNMKEMTARLHEHLGLLSTDLCQLAGFLDLVTTFVVEDMLIT
jgi:hypothetical protein